MNTLTHKRHAVILLLVLGVSGLAFSGQRRAQRVVQAPRYRIVPTADATPAQYLVGDEAPPMTFELVRPLGERITIGRLFTSCSCVQLSAPKRTFEPGERAVLTLRNIRPTPPQGHTYVFTVQLTSPVRTSVDYRVFVQSDRFRRAPALPATAMRVY